MEERSEQVCDICFLLFTEAHAPRLPPVNRMPSSLLIERNPFADALEPLGWGALNTKH